MGILIALRVQLSWEVRLLEGSGTLCQNSGFKCNSAIENLFVFMADLCKPTAGKSWPWLHESPYIKVKGTLSETWVAR